MHFNTDMSKMAAAGRRLAQLVEWVSHVQRLCPHCSGQGLSPGLGHFAVCHSPSLSHPVSCCIFNCAINKAI